MNHARRVLSPASGPILLSLALLLSAGPAAAQDDPAAAARIAELGQKALKLYDDLEFANAVIVLEQALKVAVHSGLDDDPGTARIHLYLGMVRMGGLQQREAATQQFRMARRIDPTITPAPGLFNPEVAALFAAVTGAETPAETNAEPAAPATTKPKPAARATDSAAGDLEADLAAQESEELDRELGEKAAPEPPPPPPPVPRVARRPAPKVVRASAKDQDEDEDEDDRRQNHGSVLLAVGVGAGGGTSSGHIDMKGVTPNRAPGRFAISELGHATITAGYFVSNDVLIALEGRLQLVTGATPHCEGTTCSDTSTFAAAGLVKLSYFVGQDSLRWFGTLGVGGGRIRQVVKLTGLPDCGTAGDQQCFDTVTGGPFLMAAGTGLAYQFDTVILLAGATANVGVPDVMLNVDLTLGAGLRF